MCIASCLTYAPSEVRKAVSFTSHDLRAAKRDDLVDFKHACSDTMRLLRELTAALQGFAALTAVAHGDFSCGTPNPSHDHLKIAHGLWRDEVVNGTLVIRSRASIVVDTYLHVLASSLSATGGYIDDAGLHRQMAVLNANFGPHDISFRLQGVTRTVNAGWAGGGDELRMKRALRQGGYASLNVYFLGRSSGILGKCTFPQGASIGSNTFTLDGCTVASSTIPGGKGRNVNLGKTLTHETGHWLGLYHTFRGGCDGEGDLISDTPAQASPTRGCPPSRDSCPHKPGLDPIHNYMDYSIEEFTIGQRVRMHSFWRKYRLNAA
ncbi:Extracellular metalloprotease [Colletotrichum higginsianum IMI 349063]|uniref:Extracellular metalloprotease n=1 Tax=Colletotrichum higginsianum (strain IMI 349063) TaxID=759273 RepID=A0A1B7Y7Y4_COLHI|nr:Extracellular metalloprotease [Colletotrichum higginsianum IMI 349063]OBR08171.1 Extracellular metalloprotease [Colletotrichum higginsianum IMI 349063]